MLKPAVWTGWVLLSAGLWAGEPHELPPLTVSDSATRSVESMDAFWNRVPEPVFYSQGGLPGQSDLRFRQSAFSAAGLSLNGLAITHAQTEHFHAELPFPAAFFQSPRLHLGAEQAAVSDGHAAGALDLSVRPVMHGVSAAAAFGSGPYRRQAMYGGSIDPPSPLAAAAHLERFTAKAVDYDDNDVYRIGGGLHLQWSQADRQAHLLFAHQHKTFGARGYYGVTPDWAARETLDDDALFFTFRSGSDDGAYLRLSALYREFEDEYTLYWTRPGVYRNAHVTTLAKTSADGLWRQGAAALRWRIMGQSEEIDSTNLGAYHRSAGELFVQPAYDGLWRFQAGLSARAYSEDTPAWGPSVLIESPKVHDIRFFISGADTARQPSYTELNYESPGSLGNQNLNRADRRSLEAGLRWEVANGAAARAALFQDRDRHIVEWIKAENPEDRWTAVNLNRVTGRGFEGLAEGALNRRVHVGVYYLYLDKDGDRDFYAGRYVWDYARHTVSMHVKALLSERWSLAWHQRWIEQAPHPVRDGGRFAAPADLELIGRFDGAPSTTLRLFARNVWNDGFQVFPGQKSAARRYGLEWTWSW